RVSQVMNLLNLAPDIQEALLFLPRTERGRAPIILAQLQPIASTPDWKKQRRLWGELARDTPRASRGGASEGFWGFRFSVEAGANNTRKPGRSTSMVTAARTSCCGSASGRGSEDVARQPLWQPTAAGPKGKPQNPALRTLGRARRATQRGQLPE